MSNNNNSSEQNKNKETELISMNISNDSENNEQSGYSQLNNKEVELSGNEDNSKLIEKENKDDVILTNDNNIFKNNINYRKGNLIIIDTNLKLFPKMIIGPDCKL